ncbi:MAG TPA: hypothetical protein VFF00_07280, partial [Candidatus Elarobacter sp.]|nr:hypothetical protein [Candidatus Elarobacter sp.]
VETSIEAPAQAPAPVASAQTTPAAEREPPLARPRPRPSATARPAAARAAAEPLGGDLGLPEIKHGWTFPPDDDARPILPEPPPPRATYEDRGGAFDL